MKKIFFTGGGSAGHVTVNLALIPKFLDDGWEVGYVGSYDGIERHLVQQISSVRYIGISTGKFRRYIDINNLKDPFKVLSGIVQAYNLLKKERPLIVFSKGGFVSVPVIIGAWLNSIPIITHESDITPGLANKITSPISTLICTTFEETANFLAKDKCRYVGPVIREEIKGGDPTRGRVFTGFFNQKKPVLLIMGGSLGSNRINEVVRQSLTQLTKKFLVVHICGRGQIDNAYKDVNYRQYEYLHNELADVLAMSDFVVSRAGSNSIFEFLCLRKPMLLIPLPKKQSRGDQISNALSFEKKGCCKVMYEEDLNPITLNISLMHLVENKNTYINNMEQDVITDPLSKVYNIILDVAKKALS